MKVKCEESFAIAAAFSSAALLKIGDKIGMSSEARVLEKLIHNEIMDARNNHFEFENNITQESFDRFNKYCEGVKPVE